VNKKEFCKVLIFVSNKKIADSLFETLAERFPSETCVIHANKTQNYRVRSISQFDEGINRILVTTDIMARGLDLDKISHVINFEVPTFPENYMHRIGRTGRAEQSGNSILFFTPKENDAKLAIEKLMDYDIPLDEIPQEVIISKELTAEERSKNVKIKVIHSNVVERGAAFHEKSEKNKKTNQGKAYHRELAKKYKKPKTRGDKNYNRLNKKK